MLFRQICLRGHKFIESFFHAFLVETFHFAAGHCDFKKGFASGDVILSMQSATEDDCYSAKPLLCHSGLQHLPLSFVRCLSSPHVLSFLGG